MESKKIKARDRIIATATRLFVTNGFAETSIADICRESGISNGSVFHHFGSKDAILRAVYMIERRAYWDSIFVALDDRPDPLDALGALVRATFAFEKDNAERFKFLVDAGNSPSLTSDATANALNTEYLLRAGKWAGPHIKAGRLPRANPFAFAALLFGPHSWIARTRRFGMTIPNEDEMIDELVAMLRRAFATEAVQEA